MELDFKSREEVPGKYKIDLSKMFKNTKEWYKEYEDVLKHINDLDKYKGHILDSFKTLEEVLTISDNLEMRIDKLYIYAHVSNDCDLNNQIYNKMYQEVMTLISKYDTSTAFVTVELLESDYSLVEKYINENKNLEQYKFTLEQIFRNKKYILSDKEESILASFSNVFKTFEDVSDRLNNAEIKYGSIKVDGIKKEITSTNTLEFLTNKNRNIRKQAYTKKMGKLKEFNGTFANNLTSALKTLDITSKLRGYKNYQEQALYADNVKVNLYDSIIKFVGENVDTYKRWYSIIKKSLGLKTMYNYDFYAPIIKEYDKKYKVEEAESLIKKSLEILGKDYSNVLSTAFKDKWIDYCTYKGKINMCYSTRSYKDNPVVFINYLGRLNNISALAHELGHAIHFYYSDNNNEYTTSSYSIFVAEVASLTNEILLSHYLINNSKDAKEKLSSVYNLIELITDNFYGAAFQAEFEEIVNTKISNEEILTQNDLNNIWSSLNEKYYAPVVKFTKDSDCNWCRIPHFYFPFYTYKYVIGICGACYVATNIINEQEEFLDKYLEFLKSGGSDYPLNQLKKLGIDLEKEDVFKATVNMLNNLMDNFENLYKEVNDEQ